MDQTENSFETYVITMKKCDVYLVDKFMVNRETRAASWPLLFFLLLLTMNKSWTIS